MYVWMKLSTNIKNILLHISTQCALLKANTATPFKPSTRQTTFMEADASHYLWKKSPQPEAISVLAITPVSLHIAWV